MISLSKYIYEALGQFSNAKNICEDIIDIILHSDKNKITIETDKYNIQTPFGVIKEITIIKDLDNNTFEYDHTKTDFDKNHIYIKVGTNISNNKNSISLLTHEIIHAINDFGLHNIGKDLLISSDDFINAISDYEISKRISQRKSKQCVITDICIERYIKGANRLKTIFGKNINIGIQDICYYLFNPIEMNAYLSALKYDVYDILDKNNIDTRKISHYQDLVNEIKNTGIWQMYFAIGRLVDEIKRMRKQEKHNFDKFESIYNKLTLQSHNSIKNTTIIDKQKTIQNFFDIIIKRWDHFTKKFNDFVPKICANYYKEANSKNIDKIK